MYPDFTLQAVDWVLAAHLPNPAIVNLDFLHYSGIIPGDWHLAQEPIYSPQLVQLIFQTGIAITAQPHRLIFAESLPDRSLSDLRLPSLIRKLVQCLPHLGYEALGINPTGHVEFADALALQQYLRNTLLAPGSWQQVGDVPMRTQLHLSYTFDQQVLNLSISEAGLRRDDDTLQPVVVFSGNSNTVLTTSDSNDPVGTLLLALNDWQAQVETFQALVTQHFLPAAAPAVLLPAA